MAKKKEEKIMENEIDEFTELLERLNKDYGKGSILQLGDSTDTLYDVISTGSIAFDQDVLGIGGFAKSKLYELRGWEGSGKSTICGQLTAECQKVGGRVAYIDSEYSLDRGYFTNLGVDIDKLLICQPDDGEQGFNIINELLKSNQLDLIIVDSDNGLIPRSVIQGEAGDSAIGKKARLNGMEIPKIKQNTHRSNTCVVFVSQFREKIGVMFGDTRTTQGGHALKFFADVIIEASKTLIKEGDETHGYKCKVKTIKNKTFSPFIKGEFIVNFGTGVDKIQEVINIASDKGILKIWGKVTTYLETKYNTDEFPQLLRDNPKLYEEIKGKLK